MLFEQIYKIDEIEEIVKSVWSLCQNKKTWLFNANMGCGKTTFINALCKYLEIKQSTSSPTFSVINEYNSPKIGIVYHLDLYRLKDLEEALATGVEDVLYSKNYCFIEWPNIIENILPPSFYIIQITLIDEHTRKISVS